MADETNSEGKIVTFYSFKGGTGRTMALANVAWILASNGLKVLVVDWDLDSPGLHRYFHPFLDPAKVAATPGIIELITDYAWDATQGGDRSPDWVRKLRADHAARHLPGLGVPRRRHAGLRVRRPPEPGLLIGGDRDRLGQLLRPARRRAVLRRAARGHEGSTTTTR